MDRKAKRRRADDNDDGSRKVLEKYDEVKDELDAKNGGMILTSSGFS